MNDVNSFDENAIANVLEVIARHGENSQQLNGEFTSQTSFEQCGIYSAHVQCLTLEIKRSQIVIRLPFGIGRVTIPLPTDIADGTNANACLDICSKFGIPCGVEVTVKVNGQRVARQSFGCC